MLNTHVTAQGIAVTDSDGNEVGTIYRKNGYWVAVHLWVALDVKAFKDLKAAEYYMLAAHLEYTAS